MMKRNDRTVRCIVAGLVLMVVTATSGCSSHGVQVRSYPPEDIIHMDQLKMQGDIKRLNDLVFYVDKGETIPLALSMDSEFMTFKQGQVDIVAKQRLYFRVQVPGNLSQHELNQLKDIDARTLNQWSDEQRRAFVKRHMVYISRDCARWAAISSIPALREVLGYKMGKVSFSMTAGTTHGVAASLNIKTVR